MIKVDIISGFLGAGKTTLIKKLIKEVFAGQQIVLIENEFGEIGIDGGFLKDAGINISEMNSGCICCSLVGDFATALKQVVTEYHPDRIIIEPSGVGKLSDVEKAVLGVAEDAGIEIATTTAVVDAKKARVYMKNFGEFFNDQVETARTIILSRTGDITDERLNEAVKLIKEKNSEAPIITTAWDSIDGSVIFGAMSDSKALEKELMLEQGDGANASEHEHHYNEDGVCSCGHHHHDEDEEHEHHHHHDHDEEEHEHHHHHDHDEEEHEHHHHHDHDEEEHEHHHHHDHDEDEEHEHHHHHDHEDEEHEHHHHHDHDHEEHEHHYDEDGVCSCGHHHDHGHHHHHADEVFTSWGVESPKKFSEAELDEILKVLANSEDYGQVLRSKGIVPSDEGDWLHFDLTPEEYEIRKGSADYTGRICVIGAKLKEDKLKELFNV